MYEIAGRFSKPLQSGGYFESNNPQIEIVVSSKTKLDMKFRTKIGEENSFGIIFFLIKCSSQFRGRRTFLDESSDRKIDESDYYEDEEVDLQSTVSPGRYIALLSLEKEGFSGQFTFTVKKSSGIDSVELLPPISQIVKKGDWKKFNGGADSLDNPQYLLKVSERTLINFRLNDRRNDNSIMIMITAPPSRSGRRKKTLGKTIASSEYWSMRSLEYCYDFPASESPYLIVICGSLPISYTLTLETSKSSSVESFEEIIEEKLEFKEDSCSEILEKHRDPDDRRFFLTNPIDDVIEYCQSNDCVFLDEDFKASNESVNHSTKPGIEKLKTPSSWKRTCEFLDDPRLYIDSVSHDDFVQGGLGDCWMISSLSSICENSEQARSNIFPKEYHKFGIYVFRMYHEGNWKFALVDDYFPLDESGELLFASARDPNEIYVPLMEKIFAKIYGSYQNCIGGTSVEGAGGDEGEVLTYLTGGKIISCVPQDDDPTELWAKMMTFSDRGWMVASTPEGEEEYDRVGLVDNHAYTVLSVHEFDESIKLVKIRNPHGGGEWNGKFSDSDRRSWTDEMKIKLQFEKKDDGIFFMLFKDFRKFFVSLTICDNSIVKVFQHQEIVEGDWEKEFFDPEDYDNMHKNPKHKFQTSKPNTRIKIYFKRTKSPKKKKRKQYMQFWLCQGDATKISITKGILEEQIVHDSGQWVETNEIVEEIILPDAGEYFLIPTIQNPTGEAYKIKVVGNNPFKLHRSEICDNYRFKKRKVAKWTSYGLYHVKNPKFKLHVNEGKTKIVIWLDRIDRKKELGFLLIILPPKTKFSGRKYVEEDEVLVESEFYVCKDVSLEFELEESEDPYTIMFFCENKFAGLKYSLKVHASQRIILGEQF